MHVIVLLNAKAGSVRSSASEDHAVRLRESFQAKGIDADVRPTMGADLTAQARLAARQRPDAIVAAGGDGTVSGVAGGLVGGDIPVGILPLGTLNHFARDLGLPLDSEKAIEVIRSGHVRRVDVGQVNDHVFINNSSIGIYPEVVRDRDAQRTRLGRGKWMAMLFASVGALRRFPVMRVRLGINDRTLLRSTPFVFVGNNAYEMHLFNVGGRQCLDRGQLSLYVAHRTGRFGMFILALRALVGRLDQAKDFESACLPELWIETGKRRLHVAADGEVIVVQPPLHYLIRPQCLRVLAPIPEPITTNGQV
jgi:diacylglycerol kinase family enzyme